LTARRALAVAGLWLAGIWIVALASARLAPGFGNEPDWPAGMLERVTPLARWDSGWYVGLSERGYDEPPRRQGQQTNHAFFPLYPLLMRLLSKTGLETSLAGNLVSAASLLGAAALFARWVTRRFGAERAAPALAVLLLFPPSLFFAAVYTEALLLFLALLAVVALEEDRPWLAALAGLLAGLTRVSGLCLVPFLLLAGLRLKKPLPAALVGLSPLAGFSLFCLHFQLRYGDPLLFVNAQHNWSDKPKSALEGPFIIVRQVVDDLTTGHVFRRNPTTLVEGLLLVLFAFLAWRLLRARLLPEAAYVAASVAIVLLTGTLESGGRYVLPAFPGFAVLGGLAARPALFRPLLVGSAVVQAGYVFLFVHSVWVG